MQKLCIYSRKTEADGAHFEEEEHILSAGLGGQNCLDKGMVSDEVNSRFSTWEAQVLRYSPLAILRQFHGPGKRGSLNLKKVSKSVVNIYTAIDLNGNEDPTDLGLCYIALGVPHSIPALQITNERMQIQANSVDERDTFIKHLLQCPESGFLQVPYDHMPSETALLGFHNGRWHWAHSSDFEFLTLVQNLQSIKSGTINILSQSDSLYLVNSHQQLTFNEDNYYKVIAKYAFNLLAHRIAQDGMLQSAFDPIREWIMSDPSSQIPSHEFVQTISEMDATLAEELPALAHCIVITKNDCLELTAYIRLYGGAMQHIVRLATNYEHTFYPLLLICDWKNRSESII